MRDHQAVAGTLGGDVGPAAALPGETHTFEPYVVDSPVIPPETILRLRDVESLLDRIAPLPETAYDPEPMTRDDGGKLRRGPLAWLAAVVVLIGVALVAGVQAPEPEVGCYPHVDSPGVSLKRELLEQVLASERSAFGLP